jgi:hypothetical protein
MSFKEAGAELGVTPTAISHEIFRHREPERLNWDGEIISSVEIFPF